MNHASASKQNRILLITLLVILAAVAALIVFTGTAQNRSKPEETPPLDKTEKTAVDPKEETGRPEETEKPDAKKTLELIESIGAKPEETGKPEPSPETAEPDAKRDTLLAVGSEPEDVLPEFAAPVDGVVIKSCSLTVPVFSDTMRDYRVHRGLDFACSPGTPVYAAADGVIESVEDDPMMGVTLRIRHSGDAVTVYKGLSEDTLLMNHEGDEVKRGDLIGASGTTALIESAEEPHLHFELTVAGTAEDPAAYFPVAVLSDLPED